MIISVDVNCKADAAASASEYSAQARDHKPVLDCKHDWLLFVKIGFLLNKNIKVGVFNVHIYVSCIYAPTTYMGYIVQML